MSQNLKVQISIRQCSTWTLKPFCVHAIAVRAGRDVFVTDFSLRSLQSGFKLCDDGVLHRRIKKKGTGFEVKLLLLLSSLLVLQILVRLPNLFFILSVLTENYKG